MKYNRTINRLIRVFGTITKTEQIPMAESYAKRLIAKVSIHEGITENCDSKGYWVKAELNELAKKFALQTYNRLP